MYEPGPGETNSEAVVTAVSDAEGVEPDDLVPLYESVDPDALDDLFGARTRRELPNGAGYVTFDYVSRRIRVESDGTVRVF